MYASLKLNILKWIFSISRFWSINQKSVLLAQHFKNTLWLSDFSTSCFSYHSFSSHSYFFHVPPTEKCIIDPLFSFLLHHWVRVDLQNIKSLILSQVLSICLRETWVHLKYMLAESIYVKRNKGMRQYLDILRQKTYV